MSQVTLKVQGKVEKTVLISSETLRFDGSPDEDLSQIVTIVPAEKYNFNILSTKVVNGENIEVELKPIVSDNDDVKNAGWELHIKNIRKTEGRYYEAINLATDLKINPTITIRVFGSIKSETKTEATYETQ